MGVAVCSSGQHLVGHLSWATAKDASALEVCQDSGAMDAEVPGERVDRGAGLAPGDEVVDLGVGRTSSDRV